MGVEFPFGHAFVMPHHRAMRRTHELALRVLGGAASFGKRVDLDIEWQVPCAKPTGRGSGRCRARSPGRCWKLLPINGEVPAKPTEGLWQN